MLDIIIIGAGPIGLYAATIAALHNLNGLVLESKDVCGGQLTSLYPEKDIIDLPGYNKVTAQDYIDILKKQFESNEKRLDLHLEESVDGFEKIDDHFVVRTKESTYETKTLLITTGMGNFTPRKTGLANEDQFKNVVYSIKKLDSFKDKRVAVLGGGDSAVDWTLMLEPIVKEISIVHRRNEFRAQSSSVERMEATKTNILTPYVPYELNGEGDLLKSIVIQNKETEELKTLDVDYLIVNFGLIPSPNNFEVEKKGNDIVVDRTMMTSVPNCFAVGNVVNYEGKVKNITCGLGEVVIAITKIDQIINPTKNIPVHF